MRHASPSRSLPRSLCLAALALLSTDVAAQTDSVWDGADDLLPNEVSPPWDFSVTGGSALLRGGELVCRTSDFGEEISARQSGPLLSFGGTLVIEARLRVSTSNQNSPHRRAACIRFSRDAQVGGALYLGVDELLLANAEFGTGQTVVVDTNEAYHTYRIELTEAGAITVFQDDEPVLSGATFASANLHGSEPYVEWGACSPEAFGTSQWESVRHNAGPPTVEWGGTLPVESSGFLNPALLVGFNPQPEPPAYGLDGFSNPEITVGGHPPDPGLWMHVASFGDVTFDGTFSITGNTIRVEMIDPTGPYGALLATLTSSGGESIDPVSAVGFDPQPEPPANPTAFGFSQQPPSFQSDGFSIGFQLTGTTGRSFSTNTHTWTLELVDATGASLPLAPTGGSPSPARFLWDGEQAGDRFGSSVSFLGDQDGDGEEDVLIGAPHFDGLAGEDCGKVYVVSSATGALLESWEGEQAGSLFGSSVSSAGDLDDDGVEDVVVGAPEFDVVGAFALRPDAGKAYVYSGASGALLFEREGGSSNDRFGTVVDGGGDLNGDGVDVVLVGSPGEDGPAGIDTGAVYTLLPTGSVLNRVFGENTGDGLGSSLAGGVDQDADGEPDFVTAAPGFASTGKIYLYTVSGALLHQQVAQGGQVFAEVTFVDDVTGDDRAELAASPGDALGAGAVYLLEAVSGVGITTISSFAGTGNEALGTSLDGVGDVNGDGVGDVLAGAPTFGLEGRVRVLSGVDAAPLFTWNGEELAGTSSLFGAGTSGKNGADVNGDGFSDLLTAAPAYSDLQDTAGRVVLLLGGREDVLCEAELGSDPTLSDSAGTIGMGPKLATPGQPFNLTLDCSGATGNGVFVIALHAGKLSSPVSFRFGAFYLAGPRFIGTSGSHQADAQSFYPTGLVLPADPSLLGVSYTAQGSCSGYAGGLRSSNAITQTIGG